MIEYEQYGGETMTTCKTCKVGGSVKCPRCNGTGRVGGGVGALVSGSPSQCTNCHGSGVVKCGACDGKGQV